MTDRFLTTREAAQKIGVSERTMEYLRSKGEGPPVTRIADRVLRYSENAVNEWLAARTESNGAHGAAPRAASEPLLAMLPNPSRMPHRRTAPRV